MLHDVSISVPPGEVTALLGPNGAGKSTLVLAVGGVLRPTAGNVVLGELDLTRRRPEQIRAAGVAIVPEGRQLLPSLTVEENLRVATYSLRRDEARSGIAYALELFPELEKRWNVPGTVALGWRAADGRPRAGARLPAEDDPRRRALARPRAARRQAARPDARVRRGDRRRRPPDRAVRPRGARPREHCVRHRGRADPVPRDGRGAQEPARGPAHRLPPARVGRAGDVEAG